MSGNSFGALEDSSSGDEDKKCDHGESESSTQLSGLFSAPTLGMSAAELQRIQMLGTSNRKESSLASMSSVLGALADTSPRTLEESRTQEEGKTFWNFGDLSAVMEPLKPKVDKDDIFNPLLSSTVREHDATVGQLMRAIKSSKQFSQKVSKSGCNRSKKHNQRKLRIIERGVSSADRTSAKVGKKMKKRSRNKGLHTVY